MSTTVGGFEANVILMVSPPRVLTSSSWTSLIDLLGGVQRLGELDADGLLADPGDEAADDLEVDVGLEQGEADLAEDLVDVGLGQAALAAKPLEDAIEPVGECLEHAVGQRTGPARGPRTDTRRSVVGRCRGRRSGGSRARRPAGQGHHRCRRNPARSAPYRPSPARPALYRPSPARWRAAHRRRRRRGTRPLRRSRSRTHPRPW